MTKFARSLLAGLLTWALLNGIFVTLLSMLAALVLFDIHSRLSYFVLCTISSGILSLPAVLLWANTNLDGYIMVYLTGGWAGGLVATAVLLVMRPFGPLEVVWSVSHIILAGGLIGSISFLLFSIAEEVRIYRMLQKSA